MRLFLFGDYEFECRMYGITGAQGRSVYAINVQYMYMFINSNTDKCACTFTFQDGTHAYGASYAQTP